jgi:Flp pilus assembly protein TadB
VTVTGGALLVAALAAAAAALLVPADPRRRLRVAHGRAPLGHRSAAAGAGAPRGDPGPRVFTLLLASVACGVGVGVLVGSAPGAVLGVVAGGLALALLRRLEPRAVRDRRERLSADLPDAVDLLAACLAVGRAPLDALAAVAEAVDEPLAGELRTVVIRLDLGADPVVVWSDVAVRPGPLGALGRTVARSLETGAPIADGLGQLADDLRRRRRCVADRRARSVGVRAAAPLGLCFLPAFVLVGIVPSVISAFAAMSWW